LTFSTQPDEGANKAQKAQVVTGQFIKPGEDTAIVFDFVNEALCQVPLSVQMGIILPPLLTMPAGWDYRHGTGLPDYLKKGVGVKAPVGDDVITRVPGKQSLSLGNVVALASSKPKAQGVAQSIYTDVDFGAEPAPAAAQRLGFLAPLFWGAPAAQEWARTMVLSRIRFSISGSWAKCWCIRSQMPFSHQRANLW
jgi:hypothetical protein